MSTPNESAGRGHDLGPADRYKTVVLEVATGVRWGPAVSVFPAPGPELSVSLIEEVNVPATRRGPSLTATTS
jgi:hypothetical protein